MAMKNGVWVPNPVSLERKESIIRALHAAGCFKFGDVTLASGQKSSYFMDGKMLWSHPEHYETVVQGFLEMLDGAPADRLAGVPSGAYDPAAVIGDRMHIGRLLLRKEQKDHGTGKQVDGDYEVGMSVGFIEDVVTTGGSSLELIPPIEKEGLHHLYTFIVVDRQQGAIQNYSERGYKMAALVPVREALTAFLEEGVVPLEFRDYVGATIEKLSAEPASMEDLLTA